MLFEFELLKHGTLTRNTAFVTVAENETDARARLAKSGIGTENGESIGRLLDSEQSSQKLINTELLDETSVLALTPDTTQIPIPQSEAA